MILLLDFDGVLHPEGEDHFLNGGSDFCFLPRLEALLREFPHVKIVISSSWREQLLYKTLLKPFSSDIRARVLGATPHSGFGLPPPYGKREAASMLTNLAVDGTSNFARMLRNWWSTVDRDRPNRRAISL